MNNFLYGVTKRRFLAHCRLTQIQLLSIKNAGNHLGQQCSKKALSETVSSFKKLPHFFVGTQLISRSASMSIDLYKIVTDCSNGFVELHIKDLKTLSSKSKNYRLYRWCINAHLHPTKMNPFRTKKNIKETSKQKQHLV